MKSTTGLEEKAPEKYEIYEMMPSPDKANWLLYSMHDIEGIEHYLKEFPQDKKESGCSATLTWSGEADYNVPVECFEDRAIGFVLNSKLIEVPQADTFAYGSGSIIANEILKKKQ